ncbi:MAG: penicillin-binding protein 2 [Dehalococcoidia bacterium]|nr:MAG: penicillin-binding protein 2 [Dehalococcoidia bacterium]
MTASSTVVRLRVVLAVFGLIFVALAVDLMRAQWLDPTLAPEWGNGVAPRVISSDAPRGVITDRNGVVLARNVPDYRLVLVPGFLPPEAEPRRAMLLDLQARTGVGVEVLVGASDTALARVDPYRAVVLEEHLAADRAIALRAALAGLPAARVEASAVRRYEASGALAHILGYVAPIPADRVADFQAAGYSPEGRVGIAGVESVYESRLRGEAGRRLILANPMGREVGLISDDPALAGATLELSIDLPLQRATEAALRRGISAGLSIVRYAPGRPQPVPAGAAVVMDVNSGEVLALVSLPAYDANLFDGHTDAQAFERVLKDPGHALIDRSYMETRSPGSIFKPLVALAALEEGVATADTRITSNGYISVANEYNPSIRYVFKDWAAHGSMDMTRALARSSDVYFYLLTGGYREGGREVFRGMGADTLARWARLAGFGRPTGIDLPGEVDGLVPDSLWKERTIGEPWVLGDTYTYGIGQGYFAATPLQMTVLAAALANGGDLLAPRVVRGFREGGRFTPAVRQVTARLPATAAHFETVRRGMLAAAAPDGTAFTGVPAGGWQIAGKTGTAEFGQPYYDGEFDTHGWYMSYGPFERPEIAVVVYLEYGVGSTHAGPVAKEIFEAYLATRGGNARVAQPAAAR